jgi:hypothetical protein
MNLLESSMSIRELFVHDLTRDIPPVVYFHDLDPAKVSAEVDEYIVTGGFLEGTAGHLRVPDGIHEQYVRLLGGLCAELTQPGGASSPGCWISGYYGSGKSSFAKLLGLALDGFVLADGQPLSARWLARDQSPRATELHASWASLLELLGQPPLAVVFDLGAVAKDGEHVHSAVVRQVQARLGYCRDEIVARDELLLERDGLWPRFLELAQQEHGRPWSETVRQARADRHFSAVMHRLEPSVYDRPLEWLERHSGSVARAPSAEEAVGDLAHMLATRAPGRTLFVVVDEVSQYVLSGDDRIGKLQAFVELLGARLTRRAWLVALGQQKLEEDAAARSDLPKLKDRFPKRLRVHLDPANIRDVVHQRLLKKKSAAEEQVRALFRQHRASLAARALGGAELTEEGFVETYPLLPAYVSLLLRITSALRRSSRSQSDDHEIRGLLQLLGEVFRVRGHADKGLGVLVALDDIYEVQRTALDSEMQQSMARLLQSCGPDPLYARVAKAVALLQLVQDESSALGTDASLVARCLHDHADAPDRTEAVTQALESMRRRNLLGYSERTGYKIQSSAAEEWERERRDIDVSGEQVVGLVRTALTELVDAASLPRLKGRTFPITARFSADILAREVSLHDPRDPASVLLDLRWVRDTSEGTWIRRSAEGAQQDRLLWVGAEIGPVWEAALELGRSVGLLRKLEPSYQTNSLLHGRKTLYLAEEGRRDELAARLRAAVDACWTAGALYFRGRRLSARELGEAFSDVLQTAGQRLLPELFPEFVPVQVSAAELAQLVAIELMGPPTKFLGDELGLLELERGQYVASCAGVVPQRVLSAIGAQRGLSGAQLLARFGAPPYGWPAGVVKAAVAALLRKGSVRLTLEDGSPVAVLRDAGVLELFEKDRAFRRATLWASDDEGVPAPVRNRIRKLLEATTGQPIDAPNEAIADAVAARFPELRDRVHELQQRLAQAGLRPDPGLEALGEALDRCLRVSRHTLATVEAVARELERLREGLPHLRELEQELTEEAVRATARLHAAWLRLEQLHALGPLQPELFPEELRQHLSSARPWQGADRLLFAAQQIELAYQRARASLLAEQQQRCEAARAAVSARPGFASLPPEVAREILQPLDNAHGSLRGSADIARFRSLQKSDLAPPSSGLAIRFPPLALRGSGPASLALGEPDRALAEEIGSPGPRNEVRGPISAASHEHCDVLDPSARTSTATTVDDLHPPLSALRDTFEALLRRSSELAHARLDQQLLSGDPVVRLPVAERLVHREVRSEIELEALLAELRALIAPHVAAGRRVRLT